MTRYICKSVFGCLTFMAVLAGCSKNSAAPDSVFNTTGKGGSMARFAVAGNYLYTVDNNNLQVFDVSVAAAPRHAGVFQTGAGIETIFPRDAQTLFIGSQNGMYIYSIQNPERPELLSNYIHVRSCDPVVADDKYAYVTLRSENSRCGSTSDRLEIIDIENLKNPQLLTTYNMTNPKGVGIENNKLFVCDAGLKVFDAKDVLDIKPLQHFNIEANDVIPNNGNLMVIGNDGFYQYQYDNDTIKLLSKMLVVPM